MIYLQTETRSDQQPKTTQITEFLYSNHTFMSEFKAAGKMHIFLL